jgi:hypothetical protein
MVYKFTLGEKVVPIQKTSRGRSVDSCASYYRRLEMKQGYLYVNGVDEEKSKEYEEPCYWCDAIRGAGDSYKESDLVSFIEK